ncbi:hypothetical protein CPB86DRAFT_747001 [Serendipita vermifera]|nr:hypothetical protein CPB86DRAFT_747001 [Serendipita vermifera]
MAPAEKTTCRASQPLPAVLPSFLEPVPECTNEPFEASIPFNPSMATTPVLLRTTRTHALGGPFLEVSINVPRVRQIDLPKCPGQNATKKELLEVINRLFGQLERANEELSSDYARLVSADLENAHLRQLLYGKSSKTSKTTHIQPGARILTAPNQIEALCEVDRKNLFKSVFNEMKPYFAECKKLEKQAEHEKELERDRKEKMELKIAKDTLMVALSRLEKVEKQIKRAETGLENAVAKDIPENNASIRQRAKKSRTNWEEKLRPLRVEIGPLLEQWSLANRKYDALVAERDARLAAIKLAEEHYKAAIEAEEREKELENAPVVNEYLLRDDIPKRLKNPVEWWKRRAQEKAKTSNAEEELEEFNLDDCIAEEDLEVAEDQIQDVDVGQRNVSEADFEWPDKDIDPFLQFIDYQRQEESERF